MYSIEESQLSCCHSSLVYLHALCISCIIWRSVLVLQWWRMKAKAVIDTASVKPVRAMDQTTDSI